MFDSMIGVGIAASSFAAQRQGVLAQVAQGGNVDISNVIVLAVIAWALVNVVKSRLRSARDRVELDRDISSHERSAFRDDVRLEKLQAESERLRQELAAAKHLIAVMRSADYVPMSQVPDAVPSPDEVFSARAVTPSTGDGQCEPVADATQSAVASARQDDDEIAAQAFEADASVSRT